MEERTETIYKAIGGAETVERLIQAFYKRVAKHPLLKPIFPEDLTETKYKQRLFLTQFFGGPPLYLQERGHPRLRRRHLPFPITPERARAWLDCMNEAIDEAEIKEPYASMIFERLTVVAGQMVNKFE